MLRKTKNNNHISPTEAEFGADFGNTPNVASTNPKDFEIEMESSKAELKWNLKIEIEQKIRQTLKLELRRT